jgi:hypothetical protein
MSYQLLSYSLLFTPYFLILLPLRLALSDDLQILSKIKDLTPFFYWVLSPTSGANAPLFFTLVILGNRLIITYLFSAKKKVVFSVSNGMKLARFINGD